MPDQKTHRGIYARTPNDGVQLAASSDRWHLFDDHVHLAPHRAADGTLRKFDAELMPFIDSVERGALVVIDMQNDFCSPGGWTDTSGLDYAKCREAIPGVQRAVAAARAMGMWVVWVYWYNRPDLRNLGAPTLYSFKHKPGQKGTGEAAGRHNWILRRINGAVAHRRGPRDFWRASAGRASDVPCAPRRAGSAPADAD